MKTAVKLLRVIALAMFIGCTIAACNTEKILGGGDDGGDTNQGGNETPAGRDQLIPPHGIA